jgi:hypothetical protein
MWNCLNVKDGEVEEKVDESDTSETEQRKTSSIGVCSLRFSQF